MRHLVLVDDDQAFGSLMMEICRDEGLEIEYFEDPDTALAAIRATPPLLVISDVFLRGKPHGVLLAQELRSDALTANIPLVLASVERAYLESQVGLIEALGCKILIKPFSIEELLLTLRGALHL